MKNKIYQTFDEAVADVPDGSVFMSPGFGGVGLPRNLLAALNRQGAKNLTGISNNAGTVDAKVDVGTLVAAGQMKLAGANCRDRSKEVEASVLSRVLTHYEMTFWRFDPAQFQQ